MTSKKKPDALTQGKPLQDMYLSPNRQCTALSKVHQRQCRNRAMVGQRTCRMHGGATKKARLAADRRVAEASGFAADLLVEFMADPETSKELRTRIAQDLLDRNGVVAKRLLELTVEKGPSFEDYVGMALIDVEMPEGDDGTLDYKAISAPARQEDVIDAEVVDDAERWEREDEARERAQERERMQRGTPANPAPAPPVRKVSTADPYADRYEDPKNRRTMSPKRWEQHQKGRRNG